MYLSIYSSVFIHLSIYIHLFIYSFAKVRSCTGAHTAHLSLHGDKTWTSHSHLEYFLTRTVPLLCLPYAGTRDHVSWKKTKTRFFIWHFIDAFQITLLKKKRSYLRSLCCYSYFKQVNASNISLGDRYINNVTTPHLSGSRLAKQSSLLSPLLLLLASREKYHWRCILFPESYQKNTEAVVGQGGCVGWPYIC